MRLTDCHNVMDFRRLAKKRLPKPVFDYIDGGADDEITLDRSTRAFDDCDLLPDVLSGVAEPDLSVTVMGKTIAVPFFLSPTAMQRLFHWRGEKAVAKAAEKYGTWCGISTIGTTSLETIGKLIDTPKLFQFYVHRDQGLNRALLERAREAGFDAVALTVDTAAGGNRERDLRSGFTTPLRMTPRMAWEFATHPYWTLAYLTHEKFDLPNLSQHVAEGSNVAMGVTDYMSNMLDDRMDWAAAEQIRKDWGGEFCIKGLMSAADAKRAVDIGATAVMVSNHGGRQLDGSRAPFDQLSEIVDAVGDRLDVILDGGVRRGSHMLKALSLGAKAVSGGRLYLYALAAAGQPGVERVLALLRAELVRDMKLMGKARIADLSPDNLRWR